MSGEERVPKRERRARKVRKMTTTPIGLTARSYVWGPGMIEPLIEWANHMGYGYTLHAEVEEGNPTIQIVFHAARRERGGRSHD